MPLVTSSSLFSAATVTTSKPESILSHPVKAIRAVSTLTGLSIASASTVPTAATIPGASPATERVITIVVGSPTLNKSLVFTPNEVTAQPGDILQFQFSRINHTVTQSSFSSPCQPLSAPGVEPINSGFIPTTANATEVVTFNVPINDTKPIWMYCAQGPHCMLGMVLSINAPTTGNETFAAYKAASAQAKANIPAAAVKGGVMGMIPSSKAVPPPV
ncbi:hypothetical protein BGZ60DRAFT_482931 [Tricladium varicosporioides]|nr:hypothetical protein BGZ60DRAFT_482931 [Hymenoscyphus varicosporioides]